MFTSSCVSGHKSRNEVANVTNLMIDIQDSLHIPAGSVSPPYDDGLQTELEHVWKQKMNPSLKVQRANDYPVAMILSKSTKQCTDNPHFRYNDIEGQHCKWVAMNDRKMELCEEDSVKDECAKSCGTIAKFAFKNKCRTCGWIKKEKRSKACDKDKDVVENCSQCCEYKTAREILGKLYYRTGGKYWTHSSKWTSSSHECTWHGIVCVTDEVYSITLPENNLTGTIPPELFCLARLELLDMSDNSLSGTIPSNVGNLVKLKRLRLNTNVLSGEIPPHLCTLEKFKHLDLGMNKFTGQFCSAIDNLQELIHLDISHCRLGGSIPSQIGNIPGLRTLALRSNDMVGTIPTEVGKLGKLEILLLDDNKFSGKLPVEVCNLSKKSLLSLQDDIGCEYKYSEKGCTDNPQYLFQGKEGQNCKWISRRKNARSLCKKKDVKKNCMKRCEIPYKFEFKGKCKKCGWISSFQKSEVCTKQKDILGNCIECCNFFSTQQILKNLYDSTAGDSWRNNQGWNSGADPCTWHGVTCDMSWVSSISLSDNWLMGTIPPELFCLISLESLDISDNYITGSLPNNLGNMLSLESLVLNINELTGQIPPSIKYLVELTDLRLGHNQFTGSIPSVPGKVA